MEKILNTINKYVVFFGISFFAVFFLAGFASPFSVPKEIFLAGFVSIFLILSLIKSIAKSEVKFSPGKFDIGIILIIIAYILSSILKTPNKMEAFFFPGTTTFIILSAILYFVINQFSKRGKNGVLISLFTSGILLSIAILFAKLGLFTKIPQLPAFMKNVNFNPSGAVLQSVAYMLAVLPIGIIEILKDKDPVKKIFFGVASAVLIFGIVLTGSSLLPGKALSPVFPSWQTSWSIVVDSLKESPVLGIGPGNYLSAFNLYRPLTYNMTDLWQLRFSSANNFYFTLITEAGLLGLSAFIILLISVYKKLAHLFKQKAFGFVSLIITIAVLAFIPADPTLIFLLMALLAVFSGSEENSKVIAGNKVPSIIVAAPVFLSIIALFFFGSKAVRAEIAYQKSIDALSANDAQKTYDYMVKAATLNPYVDRYHSSLSQIEMALANTIANKTDINDTDRNTVTQLVQQAISEGKATVTLNPARSGNWEVLAQIYRNIMSFAEGADEYAVSTFTQAVALDPIDPNLRISLGGVYYALGQYDKAIASFQLAVAAKSNHPNAHYNLAAAYMAAKQYDNATVAINNVLSLVDQNSPDYKIAQDMLEQIKKQKSDAPESTGNLTSPEKLQESNIEPPITLPNEATPPAQTE